MQSVDPREGRPAGAATRGSVESGADAAGGQLDAVVRLDGRDPEVAGTVRAVELTGRDDDAGLAGEIARGGPGVALRGRHPEVEGAGRQRGRVPRGREARDETP